MPASREFRELLIADLAVVRGIAAASDAAAALQRFWGDRQLSVADEIVRIGNLDPDAMNEVVAEVDRMISAAGGNAQVALTRHGGLDRSIHLALSGGDARLSMAFTQIGAGVRAPLRTMAEDRYLDFRHVGHGGMGYIYWALDSELSRQVAFKMIRTDDQRGVPPETPLGLGRPGKDTPASRDFETLKTRFLQEAMVTGGLEHPGIVPVYEIGQTPGGVPYYTMRFVRGERTLSTALDDVRDKSVEDRLLLLEPFLKLCDTVSYAHSRGVIHRDLKPDNVALGEFGEVVLLDWGLAKLEGQEDLAASRWQDRVQEIRDAADLRTIGMAGTPGYIPPETALGRIEQVDQKSDVYSLGAILFEILTGRKPLEFATLPEFLDRLQNEDAPEASSIDAGVPQTLSDLCALCLSRDRMARPDDVAAITSAIRSWQAASAIEREVEGHLRDARSALDAAEASSGDARLRHVDRAAAMLSQVAEKEPENAPLDALRERVDSLREAGVRERERAAGRRLLARIGVAALVLVTVAAFVMARLIEERRREAANARLKSEQTVRARHDAMRNQCELAMERTHRFLSSGAPALKLLKAMAARGELEGVAPTRMADYLAMAQSLSPGCWSIIWGGADGTSDAVLLMPDGQQRYRLTHTENGTCMFRWYTRQNGAWAFDYEEEREYEPRERAWYVQGLKAGGDSWTAPFVYFTTKEVGCTLSTPQLDTEGALQGVWALDFRFTPISHFLGQLEVFGSGRAYLLSPEGLVLAVPVTPEEPVLPSEYGLARAGDYGDPMLSSAWRAYQQAGCSSDVLAFDGYLAVARPLREGTFPAVVLVVAPEEEAGE